MQYLSSEDQKKKKTCNIDLTTWLLCYPIKIITLIIITAVVIIIMFFGVMSPENLLKWVDRVPKY